LSCIAVPEGFGVKLAERSDCKFYDKGNVRSKQLLAASFSAYSVILYCLFFLL